MGKLLKFQDKCLESPPDNIIVLKPMEFRRSDWESNNFIQMLRPLSIRLEKEREEIYKKGGTGIRELPPHFTLKNSMANTILALFTYRDHEEKMRDTYYLAGLIDCMINQINPLLRTDLIRDIYKKAMTLKSLLNINWHSSIDHVLFPIDNKFYNELEYRESIQKASTMKELYNSIREGTDEMFDILSLEYVFYAPCRKF